MSDPDPIDERGPAAQARASRIVTIGGERKSAIKAEKTDVRRYDVECRIDALSAWGQLSDRQWAAGMRFRFHWMHSTWHPRVTASYGEPMPSGGFQDQQAARSPHAKALDEFSSVMDQAAWDAISAVAGEDETCAGRLYALQRACNAIADYLKMDREYSRR